jgi:hypothetical protein
MAQKAAPSVGTLGAGEAVGLGSAVGDGLGRDGDAVGLGVTLAGGAVVPTELPQATTTRTLRRPTTSGRALSMPRMVAPTASMGR